MAVATAYSNLLYDSKPLQFQNEQFAEKLAMLKSKQYEQAYSQIESLKQQTLNLGILNKEADAKVNQYNEKINKFFEGKDLAKMDLANTNIANEYINIFSEIGNDQELISHKKKSDEIRNTLNTYKGARANPAKTGWSSTNETVFMYETVNEYVNSDSQKALGVENVGYIPYHDYTKELKGMKATLSPDGSKWTIRDNKGGMTTFSTKELTPAKISLLLGHGFSPDAVRQMEMEGKSNFYRNYDLLSESEKLGLGEGLKQENVKATEREIKRLQEDYDKLKGIATVSEVDPAQLQQLEADIETQKSNLSTIQQRDYNKYNKIQLASLYGANHKNNKIQGLAHAMSSKVQEKVQSVDQAFMQNRAFKLQEFVAKSNVANQQARLQLDTFKATNEANKVTGSKGKPDKSDIIGYVPGGKVEAYNFDDVPAKLESLKTLANFDLEITGDELRQIKQKPEKERNPYERKIIELDLVNAALNLNETSSAAKITQQFKTNPEVKNMKTLYKEEFDYLQTMYNNAYNQSWVGNNINLIGEPTPEKQQAREALLQNSNYKTQVRDIWKSKFSEMVSNYVLETPVLSGDKYVSLIVAKKPVDDSGNEISAKDISPDGITYDGQNLNFQYTTGTGESRETKYASVPYPGLMSLAGNDPANLNFQVLGSIERFIRGNRVVLTKTGDGQGIHITFPDLNWSTSEYGEDKKSTPLPMQDVNAALSQADLILQKLTK